MFPMAPGNSSFFNFLLSSDSGDHHPVVSAHPSFTLCISSTWNGLRVFPARRNVVNAGCRTVSVRIHLPSVPRDTAAQFGLLTALGRRVRSLRN